MTGFFKETPAKFKLGRVIWPEFPPDLAEETSDVEYQSIGDLILNYCLIPHQCGDWGDVDQETKKANEYALEHGGRLVSKHILADGYVEIVTEADRSVTRITISADLSQLR